MIEARDFIEVLKAEGLGPSIGLPCQMLQGAIACASADSKLGYFGATSIPAALGIAAGFALTGHTPVIFMQNTELGEAIASLSSLNMIYGLPGVLVVAFRGEPYAQHGETQGQDESQHRLMSRLTMNLLQTRGIPFEQAANEVGVLRGQVHRLAAWARERRTPVILMVRRGVLAEMDKNIVLAAKDRALSLPRSVAFHTLVECLGENDAVIASTEMLTRELYALGDRARNFYMMESLGCASAIALGVALANKKMRVVVLDDACSLLRHIGNMVNIGGYCPPNLIHVVFDNGCYEPDGADPTLSRKVRLDLCARAAGYSSVSTASTEEEIRQFFQRMARHGPHFLHIYVAPGGDLSLAHPPHAPHQMARRFAEYLKTRGPRIRRRDAKTECVVLT